MDQTEQKLRNIVEGLFFAPTILEVQPKAAAFSVKSLRGVSLENLKELGQRLGTDDIDVIGVKDDVHVIVRNLSAPKKWRGFKSKKVA